MVTGRELDLRVLGRTVHPLEPHGTDQGTAKGTGRALPPDRRSSVQELADPQPEHLGRRPNIDELGPGSQHALNGERVRSGPARVGHDGGEISLGTGHGRTPLDAMDADALAVQRLREQLDARGGDDRRGGQEDHDDTCSDWAGWMVFTLAY
jgi:hypothetical protein